MLNNSINGDMIRGHIDTIILLSLVNGDKHTNEIRDEIEAKTSGKYKVKQGTFYSALQRLTKQGYVSEYRSSTADSIRRKYFHLTEKGKNYVNANVDSWNYSKTVLDELILDEAPIEKKEIVSIEPINNAETEFEELLKNSDNIEDFSIKQENEELDDYFKQLNDSLKIELNELSSQFEDTTQKELPKEENTQQNKDLFDNLLENTDIKETNYGKNDNLETITEEDVDVDIEEPYEEEIIQETALQDSYTSEIEENISILDEETEEYSQEAETMQVSSFTDNFEVQQQVVQDISLEKSNEEIATESTIEDVNVIDISSREENLIDNTYINSDKVLFGKDESKETYSQILDKLFANSNSSYLTKETEENTIKEDKEDKIVEFNTEQSYKDDDLDNKKFEELLLDGSQESILDLEKETINNLETVDVITENKPVYNYAIAKDDYNKSYKIDYSDIVNYAKQEGFKVRTSFTTNKSEIGKILINKLNFHTALFFMLFAIIELCILCAVFKTSILPMAFYIVSGIAFVALFAIFLTLFLINKQKTISQISTFKNTLEVVFIICLNLILLVCAFAIISDINFGKAKDLVRYIIIPIIYVINIPLFFIIKYILLEKNAYFTK